MNWAFDFLMILTFDFFILINSEKQLELFVWYFVLVFDWNNTLHKVKQGYVMFFCHREWQFWPCDCKAF